MRFSAAHVVVLATASYVLAAPATAPESSASAVKAGTSVSKNKNQLSLDLTAAERTRAFKNGFNAASPLGSPYNPFSSRSPLFKTTKAARKAEARHFRKSSQKYCKGPQRRAILCSKQSSKAVVEKLLKSKNPAAAKELAATLDMARAFMEEHGSLTALTLRKHKNARLLSSPTTPTTPTTPATPSTPGTPASPKAAIAAKDTGKKLVARDEVPASPPPSAGPCDGLTARRRRKCLRKQARKARKAARKARKQKGASPPASPVAPQAAAAAPAAAAPATPAPQRRSFDEEVMELERRFFDSEIEELD